MVSRTVLITAAIVLIMFVLLHLRWRSIAVLIAGAAIVWQARRICARPRLYEGQHSLQGEASRLRGLRLEFGRKNLRFSPRLRGTTRSQC
ncbi:hypothetical protein CO675_26780 [Bradyrhizobium sp. C9]|nr:hypothetical protein CO675_26780 [Bradyrhizobium sp. C9]